MTGITSLLLVDEDTMSRLGMRTVLTRDPTIVIWGESASLAAATALLTWGQPRVIITELQFSHGSGFDFIRSLRERFGAAAATIVCSLEPRVLCEARVRLAGAQGFVGKREPAETLLRAVRRVAQGSEFFSEAAAQEMLKEVRSGTLAKDYPEGVLSNRELEVFRLIGRGLSTKRAAWCLGVAVKTAHTHRYSIKQKLGLGDSAEVRALAARLRRERGLD